MVLRLADKFGDVISATRLGCGLSQRKLSVMSFGYENVSYISKLENDKLDDVCLSTIDKILVALELDEEIEILYY